MGPIRLCEYRTSAPVYLNESQIRTLRSVLPNLTIEPAIGLAHHYLLTPASRVGVLNVDGLQLEIHPKIPLKRLFFILSYAIDSFSWYEAPIELADEDSVVEAVAPLFC